MRIKKLVKISFLFLCRSVGLFSLARHLTRHQLRIVCFHGLSDKDEVNWAPGLMMTRARFAERLKSINQSGYVVLPLDEAIKGLQSQSLPNYSLVITFDDGFKSHLRLAHDLLQRYGFPYTIYLTSYYSSRQISLGNLVIRYAFWKSSVPGAELASTLSMMPPPAEIDDREVWLQSALNRFNSVQGDAEKVSFLHALLSTLHLDADEILSRDSFRIMSGEEMQSLAALGVDFQLHTHRHRWVNNDLIARDELQLNADYIFEKTGRQPKHLCYPSGVWHEQLLPLLREFGVKSATTCEPGLNTNKTNQLLLFRYLDQDDLRLVEFEALCSGFIFLLRKYLRL